MTSGIASLELSVAVDPGKDMVAYDGQETFTSSTFGTCDIESHIASMVCSIACWAPEFPLMPKQTSLFGSPVPFGSSFEAHVL